MSDYSSTHWMKDSPNSEIPSRRSQEHLPEMWTIKKDLVDKLIPCLEAGLENTQEALIQHDVSLGRDMAKNRIWAETLEQEIRDMKDCIKQLKILDISNQHIIHEFI